MRNPVPYFALLLLPLKFEAIARTGTLCRATVLQTEHLVNPLGVDAGQPRLSWRLTDSRAGALQKAWMVEVCTDTADWDKSSMWKSGRMRKARTLAPYAGKPLAPFTRYFWRVTVWDLKKKRSQPSATAFFETGMMDTRNWRGSWISDGQGIDVKPAPCFRKVFQTQKKVRSARAYIAAAGLYELYLNGSKVGNHRLDPMYTRFDRRTLYVTYDVTAHLKPGNNAVGVLLGNGWYNHQSTAVWDFHKAPWRNRPAFCLDIRVTYNDGSVETVTSDRTWKSSLSPVIFNSIYTAEHQDARRAQPGWNTAAFADTAKWKGVILRSAPSTHIVSQQLYPIRNVEAVNPVSMKRLNDTTVLYDLGRNISGVSRITVKGAAGTVLRLKHGERLYENGHIDMSNIDIHYRPVGNQDPFQVDVYTLGGKGEETFMPHFNYKGFQYVEVSFNRPVKLEKGSLTGYFMHSDVPAAGAVTSGNTMINKLWAATNASYLSNLFGYPTDCPQREKNGWTGDAHIASETGLYNFDGITVYEKWLADHRDEQQPNGVLPSIIPTGGWGYEWGNGPDWTSTIAIIPWNVYLFYGDATLLADSYVPMKKYIDHIRAEYPDGLTTWGLGDWVPVKSKSPVELTSSVYYFADVKILAKTAGILGKNDDKRRYEMLADTIRNAINTKYLNRHTGVYAEGKQTQQSMPLYWNVVPDDMRAQVAAKLAEQVKADHMHLDVGLLGTKAILNALSENGYADMAWQIATQEDEPSWGWWIKNGATTLYENWPINAKSDISMNHIMFGEIGAWLFKGPGGIRPDEDAPGFANVLLEPHFVKGLNRFEARHEAPQGTVVSRWERNGGVVRYAVTLPPNSTATLILPGGSRVQENGREIGGKKGTEKYAGKTLYKLEAGKHELLVQGR